MLIYIYQDKSNLATIKATLHYVENVASVDSEDRKHKHLIAAKKLRSIITHLERQLQGQ